MKGREKSEAHLVIQEGDATQRVLERDVFHVALAHLASYVVGDAQHRVVERRFSFWAAAAELRRAVCRARAQRTLTRPDGDGLGEQQRPIVCRPRDLRDKLSLRLAGGDLWLLRLGLRDRLLGSFFFIFDELRQLLGRPPRSREAVRLLLLRHRAARRSRRDLELRCWNELELRCTGSCGLPGNLSK